MAVEEAAEYLATDVNACYLRAARAGNPEKVLEHLKSGVDINISNQNGLNALHLASKEGHVEVVSLLIKHGANVDAPTKKGNTALHIAALAGQTDVVKELVTHNADVNAQSQNGFSPLYMAAQENHVEVVSFLLDNGCSQSIATEDGFTPLAVALQQGHESVVSLLLENDTKGKLRLPALHIAARKDDTKAAALLLQNDHNADTQSKMMVNRTTESGFTPLHIASHYGNINVATLLLNRGAAVDFKARNDITPLHVASKRGNSNMVRLLLERHAHIDARTKDGLTPLHCGSRSGHDQVVEILLQRGAALLSKTKNGLSPLHMAAQGDHLTCVQLLLHHEAPVDDVTNDLLTALHVAAHCGHYKVAKVILDKRADPNATALNGFTPLHISCKKNRVKVMELLLKHGASLQAVTESGLTPIHVAAFMGHQNIVQQLISHGASPNTPNVRGETSLHMAVRAGQSGIVQFLINNGAAVDARAKDDQTPLHIASRLGKLDIVSLLLANGASPDASTSSGYTPLHLAAREGHRNVAASLLEHGATLAASTKKGFSSLHVSSKYGHLEVVDLLLRRDAPPDLTGKSGLTALHVAVHYDHQEVALLLLDRGASPHSAAKNGYTPLHISSKKNQSDLSVSLLDFGASPVAVTKTGITPLHLAAQGGHAHLAAMLLGRGSEVNARSKSGLTSLHLAAQEDKVGVAEVLANHGAELNPETKLGYTPLHIACHYGNVKMADFLLKNQANVNARTRAGYSPLHQAAQQGHTHIINLLLTHGAQPNLINTSGSSALSIARRLGYISVVETLRTVTEDSTQTVTEKHKINVPETINEVLDLSDDEGEDAMTGDSEEKFLAPQDLKDLGDDSLPNHNAGYRGFSLGGRSQSLRSFSSDRSNTLNRSSFTRDSLMIEEMLNANAAVDAKKLCKDRSFVVQQLNKRLSVTKDVDVDCLRRCSWTADVPDNNNLPSSPVHSGFLVSFMVDARGGSMRGSRHSGMRIVVPPRKCSAPTRITCRFVKRSKMAAPPPMVEGEGLASRLVEVGPAGAHFLGPVVVEVPHFASLRGEERELIVLRSDNGENWKEHQYDAKLTHLEALLNGMDDVVLESEEELRKRRVCRIVTKDFPQYFAVVSRVRQSTNQIGPEGGTLSSRGLPLVEACFPPGALTKKIKVGLQAQPVSEDSVRRLHGNRVSFSPIVTVEPRRRKFHKPISIKIPVPSPSGEGLTGPDSAPNLRLLCSITGGTSPAQWEDITGTTPLTFTDHLVTFSTNVSARFWLADVQQVSEAVPLASQIYRELICVPYMAKFIVFAKRGEASETKLRCFVLTDDKEDKTLETQENFLEVSHSKDIEVLEGRPIFLGCYGNLTPLTKSATPLALTFYAFKENRLPFSVKVRDPSQEACGRLSFLRELKPSRGFPPTVFCNLNIILPPPTAKTEKPERRQTFASLALRSRYSYLAEPAPSPQSPCERTDLRLAIVADHLGLSWTELARELDFSEEEIDSIRSENPNSLTGQSFILLKRWVYRLGRHATTDALSSSLSRVQRSDIVSLLEGPIFDYGNVSGTRCFADQQDGPQSLEAELQTPPALDSSPSPSLGSTHFFSEASKTRPINLSLTSVPPLVQSEDSSVPPLVQSEDSSVPPLVQSEDSCVVMREEEEEESAGNDRRWAERAGRKAAEELVEEVLKEVKRKEEQGEEQEEEEMTPERLRSLLEVLRQEEEQEEEAQQEEEEMTQEKVSALLESVRQSERFLSPTGRSYAEEGAEGVEPAADDASPDSPVDSLEQPPQDKPRLQEKEEKEEEKEEKKEKKGTTEEESGRSQKQGGVREEDSDEESTVTTVYRRRLRIKGEEARNLPVESMTEETFTDEDGNLITRKVIRKVVRRVFSSEERGGGDGGGDAAAPPPPSSSSSSSSGAPSGRSRKKGRRSRQKEEKSTDGGNQKSGKKTQS